MNLYISRRSAVMLLLMMLLATFVGYPAWRAYRCPVINRDVYNRFHKGMTEAEAIEAMGLPPGDYGSGRRYTIDGDDPIEFDIPALPPTRIIGWYAQHDGIVLWLDDQGRVCGKELIWHGRSRYSFWQDISDLFRNVFK